MARTEARALARRAGIAAGALLLLIVAAAGGAILWALFRWDREFAAPFPKTRASADSAVIERGRYLALGPAHCADCHAPPASKEAVDEGREAPLSGGYVLRTFLGEMRAPNITPDSATGIGGVPDSALARFLRYGVDRRGRAGLPIMMYADLSDGDLSAILSFLRSRPPVRGAVEPSRYNLLGKIARAYFLEPFAPAVDPPPTRAAGPTREYGSYLANTVSNCASCHTARDLKTGEYTGPRFAGGMVFHKPGEPAVTAVSPNLTPDPESGVMARWDRDAFVRRFRDRSRRAWSPMPWGPFGRMTDDDLTALFLYLSNLAPVRKESR